VAPNDTLVVPARDFRGRHSAHARLCRSAGREEAAKLPPRAYTAARLSSGGTRVALKIRDENYDIWLRHMIRQTLTRLTFDAKGNFGGVCSPEDNA